MPPFPYMSVQGGSIPLTVRLSRSTHQLLTEEASHDGISAAQFVRDAVLVRCVWRRAQRGDPVVPLDDVRTVKRVMEQLSAALEQS